MPTVRRYDRAAPAKWEKLSNGYLRADAFLTRCGVFEYRLDDGSVRRELRLPDEVFKEDALKSFSLAPITLEHPPELLTANNTRGQQVGTVGESVKRDGDKVSATVLVTDADAVSDILSGKRREVSCGYVCELDMTPGEHEGQRYDAIQRRIQGNHVALTVQGRAGPEVRVRLDSGDGLQVPLAVISQPAPDTGAPRGDAMEKVLINGVWVEVPAAAAALYRAEREAAQKTDSETASKLKAAETEMEKAKAAAAAAEQKAKEAEKARADALAADKVQALVASRMSLLSRAQGILGAEAKLDSMSDRDVRLAVLAKLRPEEKFDGKSDEAVGIWFDALATGHEAGTLTANQVVRAVTGAPGGAPAGAEAAYQKLHQDTEMAWKTSGADLMKRIAR